MTISLQHIAAAILLIISLVMPLACDAARLLDLADYADGAHTRFAYDASGDECPCPECPSGHHCESDCCSSYAPLFQRPAIYYSPTLGCLHFFSKISKPPQVYFSIYVPPQNFFS